MDLAQRLVPHQLSAALADRYRLERELGQGGMATVCVADTTTPPADSGAP